MLVGAVIIHILGWVFAPLWRLITFGWVAVLVGLLISFCTVWGIRVLGDRYAANLLQVPPFIAIANAAALENEASKANRVFSAGMFGESLALYLLVMMFRARRRGGRQPLIEEFTDLTSPGTGEKTAAKGLATLLVSDLAHMRELYEDVDEQRPVTSVSGPHQALDSPFRSQTPTPNQVTSVSGPHQALDATMRVDDLSSSVTAINAEAKLSVGAFSIPVGTILSLLSKIIQAPRISGSLHGSPGAWVLTAKYESTTQSFAWRVDGGEEGLSPSDTGAGRTIDDLVMELACRIFTDLALSGTVRWRAAWWFTCGLHEYRDCLRTPRDRKKRLRKAEEQFIKALSEDEAFGLAYYDLGVVYTELQRGPAAAAAFARAAARVPELASAPYALARNGFDQLEEMRRAAIAGESKEQRAKREEIVLLCRRTRRLKPTMITRAKTWDLQGLAVREVDDRQTQQWKVARGNALQSHCRAVFWATMVMSYARFRAGGPHDPSFDRLRRARKLAANCLANLALARFVNGMRASLYETVVAHVGFRVAAWFDGDNVDHRLNIGRTCHRMKWYSTAGTHYQYAITMNPERAELHAYLAAAHDESRNDYDFASRWRSFQDRASTLTPQRLQALVNDLNPILNKTRKVSELIRNMMDLEELIEAHVEPNDDAPPSQERRRRLIEKANACDKDGNRWESGRLWIAVGKNDFNENDEVAAVAAFTRAIERLGPDYPNTLLQQNVGATRFGCLAHLLAMRLRDIGTTERELLVSVRKQLKEALTDTRCPIPSNPIDNKPYSQLGYVFSELGDDDAMHKVIEAGLLWAPNDLKSRLNHGETHRRLASRCADPRDWMKHMIDATRIYEDTLADVGYDDPEFAGRIHVRLGRILYARNECRAAVSHFRQAKTFAPPGCDGVHWRAWLGLAMSLRWSGQLDAATVELTALIATIERFEAIARWWPRNRRVDPWFGLADEPMYCQELNIIAHVLLVHVHLDRGGDLGQAEWELHCAQVRLSDPLLPDASVRCGAACAEAEGRLRLAQGRMNESIERLRYAVRLKGNAETYVWLAKALGRSAHQEEAVREACVNITRLDPAGKFADIVKQLTGPATAVTTPTVIVKT